jgi:hypothetical protein
MVLLFLPPNTNIIFVANTHYSLCISHIAGPLWWQESGEFSNYQMTRLLKRRSIQTSLEDAEKEMGGRSLSLGELEEMLSEQGVVTTSNVGMRIAADNVTRYVYIKGNFILIAC